MFKHQNLGLITSLTIGHDNNGVFPNWRIDNVVITNQVTGQAYTFPCQRSLGRSSDDGSLERLLVANRNHQVASCDDVTIPQIHETIGRYDVIMNQLACISRSVNNLITYLKQHQPNV